MLLIANFKQNCLHSHPKLNREYELQIKFVNSKSFLVVATHSAVFSLVGRVQYLKLHPTQIPSMLRNLRRRGESPLIGLPFSE